MSYQDEEAMRQLMNASMGQAQSAGMAQGMLGGAYGNALGQQRSLSASALMDLETYNKSDMQITSGLMDSMKHAMLNGTAIFGVDPGSMTGRITNSNPSPQNMPKSEEEDVVLWDGRPAPENWRGAKIAEVKRRMEYQGTRWRMDFKSVWTTDVLVLYLSTDKYSGEQADAIAATHMEALNQRRVG